VYHERTSVVAFKTDYFYIIHAATVFPPLREGDLVLFDVMENGGLRYKYSIMFKTITYLGKFP